MTATDPGQARACRALWGAVVLAVIDDYRRDAWRLRNDALRLGRLRSEIERYFASRDGRTVLALAGLDGDAGFEARLATLALDTSLNAMSRPDDRRIKRT